jgi:RNA polymerase sigma-70 factor, ECF subfamily
MPRRMDLDRRATTLLLVQACNGDAAAHDRLSPLLYDELRRIARNLLRRERPDHTLQPTALVHEAFLQLVDESQLAGQDQEARARFLGIAANAMRQILIQHARRRNAEKRGGGRVRADADVEQLTNELPLHDETLLDLDSALEKLAAVDADLARIAELRLFGGLSVRDLAPVMQISLTTAKDKWLLARAWLARLLKPGGDAVPGDT